ncbi:unnamed protein product [Candidula unifasciata]|uniref:G-protein coupled receptors family 1 profile domain-containing protein n=1 Tax=Candidula unifasciata TaxID=100452 RepID=A0A8S3Z4T4_9EUPU|nr:unnamed protein product [Candidula unifasciata]
MAADLSTNKTERFPATESALVSDEALDLFFLLSTGALLPTCLLGIATNCLNIISYKIMGFQDSATSCFFALSVSDLGSTVIFLAITLSCIIKIQFPALPVNIFDLVYVLSSDLSMVCDISIVLKTYIAIQQGCCVAFPFRVKHLFTRRKTTAVILCVYTFCVACYLPSLCLKSLRAVTHSSTNRTEISLFLKNGWVLADSFVNFFNRSVLICTCQLLILISMIIIMSGLSVSLQYRQLAWVGEYSKTKSHSMRRLHLLRQVTVSLKMERHRGHQVRQHTSRKQQEAVGTQLLWRNKELRVLKQVTLVSGIFFTCNIPAVIISIANRIVPEFRYRDIYSNLVWVLFACSHFAGLISSSTTFFIYCNFNSKFIKTVEKLVGHCRRR